MAVETNNFYGKITISDDAIATVAGFATLDSYGVVDLVSKSIKDGIRELVLKQPYSRGIRISNIEGYRSKSESFKLLFWQDTNDVRVKALAKEIEAKKHSDEKAKKKNIKKAIMGLWDNELESNILKHKKKYFKKEIIPVEILNEDLNRRVCSDNKNKAKKDSLNVLDFLLIDNDYAIDSLVANTVFLAITSDPVLLSNWVEDLSKFEEKNRITINEDKNYHLRTYASDCRKCFCWQQNPQIIPSGDGHQW